MNNLSQMSKAARLYADDHDGATTGSGFAAPSYGAVPLNFQGGALWRYLKSSKVFSCASDRGQPRSYHVDYPGGFPLSYSQNTRVSNSNLDRVKRPAKVLLLIHESAQTLNDGSFVYYSVNIDRQSRVHHGGTCVAYCDMHVAWGHYNTLETARLSDAWDPEK